MFKSTTLTVAAGAVALVVAPLPAQTVCITRIAEPETINPYGARPAIHDGVVAFLGENKTTGISGIFTTSADGGGVYTTIADHATIAPNQADTFFTNFWNPDIHAGQVVFAARYDGQGIDGLYQGDGTTLVTLVNGSPADNRDSIGPEGVAWETNSGSFSLPYFKPTVGPAFPIMTHGTPMPGGGTLVDVDPDDPSLKNGVITLASYVTHSSGVDGGVYLYDVATGVVNLVVNWTDSMPGRTELFDYFSDADCDGQNVVLVGKSGFLGFGGHQGLYIAPAVSPVEESAPLTLLAEIGDPAPGGGTFDSFGDVAIDGDVIVFEAFTGNPVQPSGMALFAKIGEAPIFRVITLGDEIDGFAPTTIDWNFRGLDGNRIVFRGTIGPPPNGGTFDYALYTATLHLDDGVTCPDDPGGPGDPPLQSCREWVDVTAPDASTIASLRDVDVITGEDIWVVGAEGFTSHWDGTTWTNHHVPTVGGVPVALENVDASTPDDVWAVGNYTSGGGVQSVTFRWDGAAWTRLIPPNPHPTQTWLMGVEAIAPDDVWAVGFTGSGASDFHMVHYDGTSWTVQALPDEPNAQYDSLDGISGTGPDDIWAVGSAGLPNEYQAIIFHYDGRSWTKTPNVPQPLANPTLYDVVAIAPDLAWAVGDTFVSQVGHRAMSMRWNGTIWEPVLTPNPDTGWNFLFGVDGVDADHVYAVGYSYAGANSEPIALSWNAVFGAWVGHDLEMAGYSTSGWAAGALPNGDGLAVGTIGYFGSTPADALYREFTIPMLGDLDCDGVVGIDDLVEVILEWGDCLGACDGDLDRSGRVDVDDVVMLVLNWG